MAAFPWGSVISAAGSLLGGAVGSAQAGSSQNSAESMFYQGQELQKEFAKKGIQWRVSDAKAAGIHPLYALGANLPTYSPSPIPVGLGSPMGDALSSAGQDIGRAVDAVRTENQRQEARLAELAVERAELENDVLRSQISRLNIMPNPPMQGTVSDVGGLAGQQLPSAVPGSGGSSASGYEVVPVEIPAVQPGAPHQMAGAQPEVSWMRTDGGFAPVPNQEAMEDADIGNPSALMWYLRNNVLPSLGVSGSPPPKDWLPEGYDAWKWNPFRQEWQPSTSDRVLPFIDEWFD